MNKALLTISFILILLSGLFPLRTEAGGASLYFSPASGTFFVGSTFDVSIFLNTGGNNVNAVGVDIKFDPQKLQIASPTAGKSFISVWVSQPTYSNIEGRASFQGGAPSPGINTSSGLVSTITFRAIAPGQSSISFLTSSQVLLDDGKGTDILSSLGHGVYTIKIPPPAGPKVFSPSHSDQNKWYKNNNLNLSWEKDAGVTDFSYTIDDNIHSIPDNISEGDHASVSYADLEDGIWYFHVKAKKGGSWGGISHYLVKIDTTAPASFSLVFEPILKPPNVISQEPIVSFITTDALSGLDHFEIKTIDLYKTLTEKDTGFFVEADSPYKLPSLNIGEHEVVVRAYDMAMNWRDTSARVDVVSIDKLFYATKKGINVWICFLDWWKLICILFPLAVLSLIIAFRYRRKKYKQIDQKKKLLNGIKEKAKKEEKELKSKITRVK